MKRYILFIIVIIPLCHIYAQTPEPEIIVPIEDRFFFDVCDEDPVVYFKDIDNKLDKFVGVWEVNNGVNYLKISITKHEHVAIGNIFFKDNDFEDVIFLKIKMFKVDGKVVYKNKVFMDGNNVFGSSQIKLIYYEPSLIEGLKRNKFDYLELGYSNNGGKVELTWNRIPSKIISCTGGEPYDDSDYLIPENLVLHKL